MPVVRVRADSGEQKAAGALVTDLRKSARWQECQIRIPGVCNFNAETTVLCHWPDLGMATKSPDLLAAYGCSECHAAVDRKAHMDLERDYVRLCFAEGILRTQALWVKQGVVRW